MDDISRIVNKRALEEWAAGQKRITNKMIRERFDIDEEWANECYQHLKDTGIIGRMGMVGAPDSAETEPKAMTRGV